MLDRLTALGADTLRFAAARVVAVAGAGVSGVAFPVLVLDLSGSAALTAAVTGLQVVPYLLLGLLAGALADRWPRRAVMLGAQAVAAAALLVVPVLATTGPPPVVAVLVAAMVVASAFVWFDAAAFGALPAIAGRERVVEANSLIWTSSTLVAVAGPAVGGLLVAWIGPAWTLAVDAATYALAAALLLAVRAPFGPAVRQASSIRADVAEGVRFVRQQPVVRALTTAGVVNSVAGGAVTALVVVLAVQELDVPGDDVRVGLLLAAVALGAFAGALALPALSRSIPVGVLTVAGLSVGLLAVVATSAAPVWWVAAGTLAAWSAGHTVVILNGIATRQRLTPDALQGRVNTIARMVAWGGTPVGAFVAGGVAEVADARLALALAGTVLVAGLVWARRAGLAHPGFATAACRRP